MNFDFDSTSLNFPGVGVNSRFQDDRDTLHSDLVGLSLQELKTSTGTSSRRHHPLSSLSSSLKGEGDAAEEVDADEWEVGEEDTEFALMSLPVQAAGVAAGGTASKKGAEKKKEQEDNFVLSAMFCAIEENNLEGLSKLLSMASIDVDQSNRHGESSLHVACGFGRLPIVLFLGERGANVGLVDDHGDSGLVWAARQGHVDVMKYLLECGVHLNQQNKAGETCLHAASKYGQVEVVEYLITSHTNLDIQDKHSDSALHVAARHGFSRIVQILLRAGSNKTLKNEEGESPLHVSSSRGHLDCVRCFLDASCPVDEQDKWGNTALHLATRRHYSQVAMYLLHAGADFDIVNCSGNTALHLSAREGLLGVTQSLCAFGCSVDVLNTDGQYPLHLAAKNGHTEIVRCLCLAGCTSDAKNKDGVTPDLAALSNGHVDICQLLKRIKRDSCCDDYIEQLIPSSQSIPKIKLKVFGSSAVGKTTLIESMKAGYFTGLFRRSKRGSSASQRRAAAAAVASFSSAASAAASTTAAVRGVPSASASASSPSSSSSTSTIDVVQREDKTPDAVHELYTKGISIHQTSLGSAGEFSIWEFSGDRNYHFLYDHFIGNVSCVHLVVFSLQNTKEEQLKQVRFWLTFLRSRIPPIEPLGDCGRSKKAAKVLLVATHADVASSTSSSSSASTSTAQKNAVGEHTSKEASYLLSRVLDDFGHLFDLHPRVFVLDANVSNSQDMKALKQAVQELKQEIVDGRDAKITNVLAETDVITQEGTTTAASTASASSASSASAASAGDLAAYTLVTQREPESKGLARTTRFLELILSYLPDWRKALHPFPVMAWPQFMGHVREQINPLAADDHLKEVIQQLQLMGEVIYLKAELGDQIVLDPAWLCQSVCGQLLSRDFIQTSRITGCYSIEDFQLAVPDWDAIELLPILEAMGMCTQCQMDDDIEYEFPCYNYADSPSLVDLWSASDRRYDDAAYAGVLLRADASTSGCSSTSGPLLPVLFPRIQACLRKHVNKKPNTLDDEGNESHTDLYQWHEGSKYCVGDLEGLVTRGVAGESAGSAGGRDCIEVRVRARRRDAKLGFFFLEEILGVIDQVLLEMSPGLAVEKLVLSCHDLQTHCPSIHAWSSAEVIKALMASASASASSLSASEAGLEFDGELVNPGTGDKEKLVDLICFGSEEIRSLLKSGFSLHIGSISTLTRQSLCRLLDPEDPFGKDWCLLAIKLGLIDNVPKLEGANRKRQSQLARLLDEWEGRTSSTIGDLIEHLESIGRSDAANALMAGCPLYRINTQMEDVSEEEQVATA